MSAETQAEWLEQVAAEIAKAGHNGWGNTCLSAAEFVRKQAEELERFRNGYQGSCYACEPVGVLNQKLEAQIAELRNDFIRTASRYGKLQYAFEKAAPQGFMVAIDAIKLDAYMNEYKPGKIANNN